MNGNGIVVLDQIARDAEAIVKCSTCGNYDISASDDDANSQAYAKATNAWKQGEFGLSSREEVISAMEIVLRNANSKCPSCRDTD